MNLASRNWIFPFRRRRRVNFLLFPLVSVFFFLSPFYDNFRFLKPAARSLGPIGVCVRRYSHAACILNFSPFSLPAELAK
jgi:hypothetical protein